MEDVTVVMVWTKLENFQNIEANQVHSKLRIVSLDIKIIL